MSPISIAGFHVILKSSVKLLENENDISLMNLLVDRCYHYKYNNYENPIVHKAVK